MMVMDVWVNLMGYVMFMSVVNFIVKVEVCWGININYFKLLIWFGVYKIVIFLVVYIFGFGDWLSCYMIVRYCNGIYMRFYLVFVFVWFGFNGIVELCIDCLWMVCNDGFYRFLKKGWIFIIYWYFWVMVNLCRSCCGS